MPTVARRMTKSDVSDRIDDLVNTIAEACESDYGYFIRFAVDTLQSLAQYADERADDRMRNGAIEREVEPWEEIVFALNEAVERLCE